MFGQAIVMKRDVDARGRFGFRFRMKGHVAVAVALLMSLSGAGVCMAQAAAEEAAAAPSAAVQETNSQTDTAQHKPSTGTTTATVAKGAPVIGWLEIEKPLRMGPSPLAWVSEQDAGLSLQTAIKAIERVINDNVMAGLVISLNDPGFSLMEVEQLSHAISRVRMKNKKVLVYADNYDMMSYLLATAADEILLQHKGMVELRGLGVEEMYFAGLLEKIGAKADFVQVGQFKGAEEPLTRTGPSDSWNENFDALLDDLYAQMITRISQGRGLSPKEIEKLFVDVWTLSDEELVKRKVVDRLCSRDLSQATSKLWGNHFAWVDLNAPAQTAKPQGPFAMMSLLFQEKTVRVKRPTIATIWAQGQITSGESAIQSPVKAAGHPQASLFGGSSIGSKTIVDAIEEARDNPLIRGVVLYIDSPGGSALASELMWQAVDDLSDQKPVYVVVGGMAASGGYYIASAADRIYVSQSSILGSIGVVGGKIVLGDLYKKLGIHVHRRSRGPMGDLFNSTDPFTGEQRAVIENAFKRTYEQFLDRVQRGRGDRLKNIDRVAQGRLFMGSKAVELGMADKLGGVETAIDELAESLSLKPGQYDLISLPGPLSLGDFLNQVFGGVSARQVALQVDPAAAGIARQLMGQQAWRALAPVLTGMLQLQQEPVLTIMPTAIIIR